MCLGMPPAACRLLITRTHVHCSTPSALLGCQCPSEGFSLHCTRMHEKPDARAPSCCPGFAESAAHVLPSMPMLAMELACAVLTGRT